MGIVAQKMGEHMRFLKDLKITYPCAEYPKLYGSSLSEEMEKEISINSEMYVDWEKHGLKIQPQTYYPLAEIEKIKANPEYYNGSICTYDGNQITFEKFISLLKNNRSDFSYKIDGAKLYFNCYKEVCDNSDKWNPTFNMEISNLICVEPENQLFFLDRVKEYLSNQER